MRRPVRAAQNVSRMCLVCGVENVAGFHARFFAVDGGELIGVFQPREEHQGYPGRLHGGLASAILDETIGRAINLADTQTWGVTVEFTVRFRKPVPLDREVRATGRITRDSSRLFEGTGEIVLEDGSIAVEARGKYVKMPLEGIVDGDFSRTQWFADPAPLPAEIDLGDESAPVGGPVGREGAS
jgi:acyl-coenzyme A thioesterase PaaI-like protein